MAESYVCMGLYDDLATAKRMYENLVAMGKDNRIYLHDAAVVEREEDGSVKLVEGSKGAGAADGALIGAVVGVLFPPSLILTTALGGAIGGLLHHVTRGLSRSDTKELGEMLDRGKICLIAVTDDASAEAVLDVFGNAKERVGRHMKTDAKDLAEALRSAG
jgi:uncharacterized membrane protein